MRFRRLSIRYRALSPGAALRLFGDPWILPLPIPMARPEWRPPVDYCENNGELAVKIEVAGMTEEQFEILLYQDVLVIEGDRPWRSSGAEARFHLAEIRYGPFRLELPIPFDIDRERVTARYEQGFLTVHLPKANPT
jgi:HSP20 family molecular chaperone IbpA